MQGRPLKQHMYTEFQLNDKNNLAYEGLVHQNRDEFENIPTDCMNGNIDSIDTNELFFTTNTFEMENVEGLLPNCLLIVK